MLYITEAQFNGLGEEERSHLLATHYLLGIHPETRDLLLMPLIDRFAGMYVLGVQGVGKSGFLITQIIHDIHLGHAVIVLDPHGDLITQCIAHLPPERTAYTYLLD